MSALGLDGILSDILAEAADWRFTQVFSECTNVLLAFENEIGLKVGKKPIVWVEKGKGYMACHLTHTSNQTEDV